MECFTNFTIGRIAKSKGVGRSSLDDKVTYLHTDHLGTARAGTDGDGNPLWEDFHTPYGDSLIAPAANDNQGDFTGHIRDTGSGLTYMQARYYDPVIGRFLSVDPVTFLDTNLNPEYFNRYTYTANDPINFSDPTGKYRCKKSACPTVDRYFARLKESRNSKSIGTKERALIDRSIKAIGEKGEKGSPKIKLKKKYGGLAKFTGKSIVINPDLVDSIDHGATVLGHEGSHLATQNETGVKQWREDSEERYDNELKAYETGGTVTSAIDKALGVTSGYENPDVGAKDSMEDFCGSSKEGRCGN